MPFALAQTASNYRDLLDKIVEFVTSASCTAAAVNAGGTGYAVDDVLTVSGGTKTISVELVVTAVSGTAVTAVRISQSGAYTSTPSNPVSVTGGGGSSATFDLTWNTDNGWAVNRRTQEAASAVVAAGGTGYSISDTLSLVGGVDVDTIPQFTVTEEGTVSAVVAAGGSLYTQNDTITLSGGTFSAAATFNVDTVDGGGAVLTVSPTVNGAYSVTPGNPVSTTGGTGSGCTLTVTWGAVATLSLATAGKLAETPSNPAATTGGGGSGATLTVTYADHTSTDFDVLLEGEGSGSDQIFVGIRTWSSGSIYNFELRGMTGYDNTKLWNEQPGISPGNWESGVAAEQDGAYVPLDNSSITYWLFVTGRKITGVFKVGASTYTNMYLGWLNPFGTASDFPYPLVVAGCSSRHDRLFNSTNIGYSGMCDPIRYEADTYGPMNYRDPAGVWNQIANSQSSGTSRLALTTFTCWPCGETNITAVAADDAVATGATRMSTFIPPTGNPGSPSDFFAQTQETGDDISLLWPAMLVRAGDGGSIPRDVHGELDGVFWVRAAVDSIPATAVSEDVFVDGDGERYIFFQNCNRTDDFTNFVIKQE
jgi:hypothetical protein